MNEDIAAIRGGVALARLPDVTVLRGPARPAIEQLDPRVATSLALRDASVRQALALDDAGRPTADLLVGVFRDELLAVASGAVDALGLAAADAAVLSIDGPFAWELLAEWDTPGAIGLPYLGVYAPRDGVLVIRAGRTGEYGYSLVCERAVADAVWAELVDAGRALDARVVDPAALRHCALENRVFDLERDGAHGLDALELQLTWRLDLRKRATGLDAIRAHRASGLRRRVTGITGPEAALGAPVTLDGAPVGTVVAAVPDPGGETWRILAAIDMPWAWPGLAVAVDGRPARSVSAPWVVNRSLFVNPQRHAWATRAEIPLPEGLRWPATTSS